MIILFFIVAITIVMFFFSKLNNIHKLQRNLIEMETEELKLEYEAILLDKKLIALEPLEMQEAITDEFRLWWILEQQFAHAYLFPIPFHRPKTEDIISWGKLNYKLKANPPRITG